MKSFVFFFCPHGAAIQYSKGERGSASDPTVRKSVHPHGAGILITSLQYYVVRW